MQPSMIAICKVVLCNPIPTWHYMINFFFTYVFSLLKCKLYKGKIFVLFFVVFLTFVKSLTHERYLNICGMNEYM